MATQQEIAAQLSDGLSREAVHFADYMIKSKVAEPERLDASFRAQIDAEWHDIYAWIVRTGLGYGNEPIFTNCDNYEYSRSHAFGNARRMGLGTAATFTMHALAQRKEEGFLFVATNGNIGIGTHHNCWGHETLARASMVNVDCAYFVAPRLLTTQKGANLVLRQWKSDLKGIAGGSYSPAAARKFLG